MKTTYSKYRGLQVLFVSALIYALAFNLSGCGKDNPVNNGGNPPPNSNDTLVYTLDSLSLYGSGNQSYFFDNSITPIFAGDSIKITFDISSNCTASDTGAAGVYLGSFLGFGFGTAALNQNNTPVIFTHSCLDRFQPNCLRTAF